MRGEVREVDQIGSDSTNGRLGVRASRLVGLELSPGQRNHIRVCGNISKRYFTKPTGSIIHL